MKSVVFLVISLGITCPCFAKSSVTVSESQKPKEGKTYREKRLLRDGAVIHVESWLTQDSDGAQLIHTQTIVVSDKHLFTISKMKEKVALTGTAPDYFLSFNLSETGAIERVTVHTRVSQVSEGHIQVAKVIEEYARRADGFFEPIP